LIFKPHGNRQQRTILIRRTAALGDVLLATAVLRPLKTRFPDHDIDFATDTPEILDQNPFIHTVVPSTVAMTDYDIIYDLDLAYELRPHGSILESYATVVGIPEIDLYLSITIPEKAMILAAQLLTARGVVDNRPLIAIQTAASFWVKNWSVVAYQQVADALRSKLGVQSVIIGSSSDPAIKGTIDLRGASDVMTSIALLSKCRAFIGLDSFLLHCAKILGIPVAAFFGHSDPKLRITIDKKDLIFVSDIECRFCHHRLRPPVFTTICQKENFFLKILDALFQKPQLIYYKNHGRIAASAVAVLWNYLQWREKGKIIAPCMKRISPDIVTPKIIQWLGSILAVPEQQPSGQIAIDPLDSSNTAIPIQNNGPI
jgi:ADP-heptose:LPS heptosyltransferase